MLPEQERFVRDNGHTFRKFLAERFGFAPSSEEEAALATEEISRDPRMWGPNPGEFKTRLDSLLGLVQSGAESGAGAILNAGAQMSGPFENPVPALRDFRSNLDTELAQRQGIGKISAFGAAERATDLPTVNLDVVPGSGLNLPGDATLNKVDVGVKGALELAGDPLNLIGGAPKAGRAVKELAEAGAGKAAKAGAALEKRGIPSPISEADAVDLTPDQALEAEIAQAKKARQAPATDPLEAEIAAARQAKRTSQADPVQALGQGIEQAATTPQLTPVQRLTTFLNEAPPLRQTTEAERAVEMRRRVRGVSGALGDRAGSPQRTLNRAKGQLSGALPQENLPRIGQKADSGEIQPLTNTAFSQQDIDSFFSTVRDTNRLRPLEKIRTADALQKTFLGGLPQPNELALLERVFGTEFAEAIARHRKAGTWEKVVESLNLSRSMFQTVLDFGAFLRQGAVLAPSRPVRTLKSAGRAVQAAVSPQASREYDAALKADPDFLRFTTNEGGGSRLYVAPVDGSVSPSAREEAFISDWAPKIPVWGSVVRASSRIHNTFLNQLRFGVMKDIVRSWEKGGVPATDQELEILSRHLNFATGRGSLGPGEKIAKELSAVLYSPRFFASRFQLPYPTIEAAVKAGPNPVTNRVLRESARDLVAFVGTGVLIATLLNKTKAARVETDARSPNFGRARHGDVTWDYWGGYQPIARYTWQIISNQGKNIRTDKVSDGAGNDAVWRFIRTKLAPAPGAAIDLTARRTITGQKVEPTAEFAVDSGKQFFLPLFAQDVLQVAEEEGWGNAGKAAPSAIGVGVQAIDSDDRESRR